MVISPRTPQALKAATAPLVASQQGENDFFIQTTEYTPAELSPRLLQYVAK
jgi:hypothetical protein